MKTSFGSIAKVCLLFLFIIKFDLLFGQTYNPNAAAAYADLWACPESDPSKHNPAYKDYYFLYGNDCAYFVSQCLKEGGLNLNAGPGLDPYGTGCIPGCNQLHLNLTTSQNATYERKTNGYPSWFTKGDVVIFGDKGHSGDHWEHAAFNVVSGTPALDAHTNNRCQKSVTFYYPGDPAKYWTADFYHIPTSNVQAPSNDNCPGTSITSNGACKSGTVAGATGSYGANQCLGCSCKSPDDKDVYYNFVAQSTSHTITVSNYASNFDAVIELRTACSTGTAISCYDPPGIPSSVSNTWSNLTIGQTYYIRVFDFNYSGTPPSSPTFDICVTHTASTSKPDLIVQNPTITPSLVQIGQQITASCYMKNQGTGNAVSSITSLWLSSDQSWGGDTYLGDISVPALNANTTSNLLSNSKQITIPLGPYAGTWYIMFGADAMEDNNESSEGNNQVFVPIIFYYTISTSSEPSSGGTTSGSGKYQNGESCSIMASANSGFTFSNWTEGGIPVSTNLIYNFTVTTNRVLVANFTQNAVNYTISTSSIPSAGGSTSGGGSYQSGQSRTVTATANSGYTFTNWTENGSQVSANASYTFTLSGNRTLVANFSQNQVNYTITTSSSPTAGGTTSGGGTYASGQSRTVTATANSGYTFTNWTENGSQVSANASYTFTLSGNRTLVANFTQNSGCTAPTSQASNITFENVRQDYMMIMFQTGNGGKRIIKINTTNNFTNPLNGSDPAANSNYSGSGEQVIYNGTLNGVEVTGLSGNTTYYFRIYEYNCSGNSTVFLTTQATNNPNSKTTSNPCPGALAPSNLSPGTTSSPGSAITSNPTFNWNTTGAANYQIELRREPYGLIDRVAIGCGSETPPFSFPSLALQNGKTYRWNVLAGSSCSSGCMSASPYYYFTYNACTTPTTQASAITFSGVGTNSITANWSNGNGSRRVVKINTSNSFTAPGNGTDPAGNASYSGSGEQVVYNGSSNNVTVTGLSAGTTYWFRVYEANCTGSSSLYYTVTASNNPNSQTTSSSCIAPSNGIISPSNPTVTVPNSINLTVTANGTAPFTYRWYWWNGSDWTALTNSSPYSGVTTQTLNINPTSTSMNGYYYTCLVSNSCGSQNNISNVQLAVTSSCTAPTSQASAITFSGVSTNSMTANWTNGNGSRRVVKINTSNSFTAPGNGTDPTANSSYSGSGKQVVYNGTGTSATVTGLSAGITYWFRVYEANCTGGSSLYSTITASNNPNSQITSSSCIAPNNGIISPSNPTVTAPNSTSLTVTANGSTPFTYQWYWWNGLAWTALANNTPYSGTTTQTLNINSTSISMNGTYYTCVVSNSCGSQNDINYVQLAVTSSCMVPTSQASAIIFSGVSTNSMTANWTNGNGSRRVVKINTSNSFTTPGNGTDPTANASYSGSGEQVVYNGSSNYVTVTGLSAGITYWFRVYEANCTGSSSLYNTVNVTNNPNSQSITSACTAPSAPATYATSIGDPANGLQHKMNLSCADVPGAEGYSFEYSLDGITWEINWAEYTSSSMWVNLNDSPNFPIYFRVRAFKCTPKQYSSYTYASPQPIYSACDDPAAPTVNGATSTSLNVTLNAETPVANPSITTYSIYCSTTSQYIQANGTLGSSEVFQTKSSWGTKTITGLLSNKDYCFYAKAKNNDGDIRYNSQNAACAKTSNSPPTIVLATVTTSTTTAISISTASGGGNVTADGGAPVTVRGVCWSTTTNPTTSDSKTSDGAGIGSFTSNITGLTADITYHVRAYAVNSAGTAYGLDVSFSTYPKPPTIASITQPTCTLSTGSVELTDLPANGSWIITQNPGGKTFSGLGTSKTITGLTTGIYYFSVTNSAGKLSGPSLSVTINDQSITPSIPLIGTVTQPTCSIPTGSVVLNGLPSSGTWVLNPGAISGTGTSKTLAGLASGTYNFSMTNASGCISSATGNVVINNPSITPSAPIIGTITQPTCSLSTGSVELNGLPSIGTWILNPGAITGTGTSRTLTGLVSGTYNFNVTNVSGCISSNSAGVVINSQPTLPSIGTISGTTTVCQGQNTVSYTVSTIANATSYVWILPPGATGSSSSNNINVNFGASAVSGNITVKGHNDCGDGAVSSLSIAVNQLPANAGSISGSLNVCQGLSSVTYSVPIINNATSYIWTLPSGASGSSTTNSIIVNYGTSAVSGNIKVKGNNACGDGVESALVVNVYPIPAVPVISINSGILQSNSSTGNQWFFDNNNIQNAVNNQYTPSQAGNYYVIVTLNGCASPPSNTIAYIPTGIEEVIENKGISIYPNPTTGLVKILINDKMDSNYSVNVYNINGSLLKELKKDRLVSDFDLDLSQYPAGIYIISIKSTGIFYQNKVAKKN
ncbi:MAG: T9SS type A sorting domain-containing protein [Bacteroidetes bacterium]|nr:T9SS type A sorting domain-containing protein [Bacteroidota bacterium]